jgi:hypothetical protein
METKLFYRIMAIPDLPVSKISSRSANHDVDRKAIGSLMSQRTGKIHFSTSVNHVDVAESGRHRFGGSRIWAPSVEITASFHSFRDQYKERARLICTIVFF